jgi:YHS domain-containing protein
MNMKKTMAVLAFVWCLAVGVVAWAADPTPPPVPTPSPSPHAGHQMPMQGVLGMQGGRMGGGMKGCAMHQNMGAMLALMKEVLQVQDALLKGVSGAEKDALQAKLVTMGKTLDSLQAQPMACPMMGQMKHGKHGMGGQAGAGVTVDPICGMTVDPAQAKAAGLTFEYEGKTYYFCAAGCKEQFAKDPKRYSSAQP